MRDTVDNKEAIEMMNRCKHEIVGLRAEIGRLKPKADAYDSIATILRLLPQSGVGRGEDLVWILDKRIRELMPKPTENADQNDHKICLKLESPPIGKGPIFGDPQEPPDVPIDDHKM